MKRLYVLVLAVLGAPAMAAAQDAMVAVRDPQTGQLRAATAAELRALGTPSLAMRPAAGTVRLRSDGRRQLHLGEAALVHATIARDADGRIALRCVEGDDRVAAREAAHADR